MPVAIKMPALSPTMEEGTLTKWLVKVGDSVSAGDIIAEIETDKATMEFETADEGVIATINIPAGTEGVKVGTIIAQMTTEGEGAVSAPAVPASAPPPPAKAVATDAQPAPSAPAAVAPPKPDSEDRVIASPLAKRMAESAGIDLASLTGTGPGGRIVKADVEGVLAKAAPVAQPVSAEPPTPTSAPAVASTNAAPAPSAALDSGIPHEDVKLSNMRKTIARRLSEAKQTIPHIYLTVDVRLDALLALRGELNAALEPRGIKLSVNDFLIKALGAALMQVPKCNVSYGGDTMRMFSRADISVAVSIPNGLITPIVTDAGNRSISAISTEMTQLAEKAKAGKLQPHEYQGGTASISNMGMMGIKQFDAVINPPQGMILAIGAGEKRPFVVDDALAIATVMSVTGSFDHRAIDGADGAQLMQAFKSLVEWPLTLIA